jgi:glucose/arabinose dehydrogenase
MQVRGSHKCSGAILRAHPDGSNIEVVAWGLRETFGLAFDRDGKLFCTENGMEERGSRPIKGDTDRVWEIKAGAWYGWPDFAGSRPATDLRPKGGPQPTFLIKDHPPLDGPPRLRFPGLAGVGGLVIAPAGRFGYEGHAFIAVTGNNAPHVPLLSTSTMAPQIMRADLKSGELEPFTINHRAGTASSSGRGGLERPVDVAFDASGENLYVLDYGHVEPIARGFRAVDSTGVLWRIRRPRIYTTGIRQ